LLSSLVRGCDRLDLVVQLHNRGGHLGDQLGRRLLVAIKNPLDRVKSLFQFHRVSQKKRAASLRPLLAVVGPCLTGPGRGTPCLAMPNRDGLPHRNRWHATYYAVVSPCLTPPRRALPGPTSPCRAAWCFRTPQRPVPKTL